MIHVDRKRVTEPAVLRSDTADRERQRAREYFGAKTPLRSAAQQLRLQQRFEWNWALIRDTAPALRELFHNKCAFCESPDRTENPLDVAHFRPIGELIGDGRTSSASAFQEGYWWLAYEWENLYLRCRACTDRSQMHFPIQRRRAAPERTGAWLDHELPLLLDPCRELHPSSYFTFLDPSLSGMVAPVNGPDNLRAETTISLFNLNRSELVAQRHSAMSELQGAWSKSRPFRALMDVVWVQRLLEPTAPYLGCLTEQFQALVYEEFSTSSSEDPLGLLPNVLSALLPPLFQAERGAAESRGVSRPEPETLADQPVGPVSESKPIKRARKAERGALMRSAEGWYIRRVEIRDYKAIRKLDLDIPRGTPSERGWQTGWKMLLGENGAGKSSVLQAIVHTFMGKDFAWQERIVPRSLLRREGKGKLAKSGLVRLFWVDRSEPTMMRFNRSRIWFEGEKPPSGLTLRAYGATRHLPRGRHKATSEAKPRDVANLFDPFVPVCDANGWLSQLKGAKQFGSAALSLKDLLGLTPRTRLERKAGLVRMRVGGTDVSLNELSAGYQSVIVLGTDIMAAVHGKAHDLRNASGIVIIDELDAHLHPRWKMQIVPRLRRTFPRLQFIATTHEPLCLRGLKENEIAVMRREGRTVVVETDLPSPEGLRVDQLLTSPLFGLHSTMDPELDREFQEYYELLAKKALDPAEEARRGELSAKLSNVGVLGHSRRDQMIYEVVDEYLVKEHLARPTQKVKLKAEAIGRIRALWKESSALAEEVK